MADELKASNQILLHQTLQGYSEGHRILAYSTRIHPRDEKIMLILSDASGPVGANSEKGYLTGYPLTESGYYALARTWPAPEMPRPGCVWTHTLLIDFTDLASISELSILTKIFRRPSSNESTNYYSSPITLNYKPPVDTSSSSDVDLALIRQLLVALYESPQNRIVSFLGTPYTREDAIFKIWSQQWPRLRRSFRFCTLSMNDRSLEGASFDIQFAPPNDRSAKARFKSALDCDYTDPKSLDWLQFALQSIIGSDEDRLRTFLRQVGSDISSGREAFTPLCKLYHFISELEYNPDYLEKGINVLSQSFGNEAARSARVILFAQAVNHLDQLSNTNLTFLVENLELVNQSDQEILIKRIGLSTWVRNPHELVKFLDKEKLYSHIAEQTLAGLSISELLNSIKDYPNIIPEIAKARPEILTDSSFWLLEHAFDKISLAIVEDINIPLDEIIISIIDCKQRHLISKSIRTFGEYNILFSILKKLGLNRSGQISNIESSWLKESIQNPNILAKVLSNKAVPLHALIPIARFSHPDYVPNDYGDDPWWIALKNIESKGSNKGHQYLCAYLLARAFGDRTNNKAELIYWSFDTIHQAMKDSRLSDDALSLVEPYFIWSFFVPFWDRCLRLRYTVVDIFVGQNLSPFIFGNITRDDKLFFQLSEIAIHDWKGRCYMEQVQKILESSNLKHYSHRISALQKLLR